jgi:predicted HTH transcriptional regulator
VITEERFVEIINYNGEQPGVEFKCAGSMADKSFAIKVVRAVLGMSNRADGGLVIIGIDDDHSNVLASGIPADQLATWTLDGFSDIVAVYADPMARIQLQKLTHEQETFVILEVAEFDDVPVLCRRAYGDILKEGALYVRSRRKPETVVISSVQDMRDILHLAVKKQLARFYSLASAAGLSPTATPKDDDLFEAQIAGLD